MANKVPKMDKTDLLKQLKDAGKVDNEMLESLRPTGSHPARLYGLAKVHKTTCPVRPILSMPGSAYTIRLHCKQPSPGCE